MIDATPLVQVKDLKKYFPVTRGFLQKHVGNVHAIDGISFDISAGETLGLVGESGCGKTTVGRTILGLYRPTDGSINICGYDLVSARKQDMLVIRRRAQMIFQDPFASLNPRWTVNSIVSEPSRCTN